MKVQCKDDPPADMSTKVPASHSKQRGDYYSGFQRQYDPSPRPSSSQSGSREASMSRHEVPRRSSDHLSSSQGNSYARYAQDMESHTYNSTPYFHRVPLDHGVRQRHSAEYMNSKSTTLPYGIADSQARAGGPSTRTYIPQASALADGASFSSTPSRHHHPYPPYPVEQGAAWPGAHDNHHQPSASPNSPSATSQEKGLDSEAGETGMAQASNADRKISCLECRSSKVKCSGQSDAGKGCERCRRINRRCTFEPHRRGRKPSTVKMYKLEQSVDTIMNALSALQEFKEKKEALRGLAEEEALGTKRNGRKRANSDSQFSQSDLSRSENGREGSNWTCKPGDASHSARERVKRKVSNEITHTKDKVKEGNTDSISACIPISSAETSRATAGLDAEAGQELGLPPLSNPLKLLAQASDSALDSARVDSSTQTFPKYDPAGIEPLLKPGKTVEETSSSPAVLQEDTEARKRGVSRRGYWSFGLYSSRHDVGPALDPILCGIISLEAARSLYDTYMRHLNARITLLDPMLATFEYVRRNSALLLTASIALASRFAIDMHHAEALANSLDTHIQEKLLPAVLLQGFRSVEISQAFIIMAAYHANTSTLDGDRSWSLLGYGIRIAAELDMNARILSNRFSGEEEHLPTDDAQASSSRNEDAVEGISAEEDCQRKLRNRERTWCNLWLFENSLSTHMGRRSTLGLDPVVHGVCSGWQRAPFAIPGDEAIAAIIHLRRIQLKNVDYFEHSVLGEASKQTETAKGGASPSLKFQLDFYCKSFNADLDAWGAAYSEGEEGTSWRMKNVRLYASYARLILNSYALKCTNDQDLLEPIYKDSYSASMVYLTLFSERLDSPELDFVHNSAVVTVAYVAVFALRLCSLDVRKHPYINPKLVFDHVRALAKALARAGNVTSWRNGAASSYAPYLSAILQRVERNISRAVDGVRQSSDSALDTPSLLKGPGGSSTSSKAVPSDVPAGLLSMAGLTAHSPAGFTHSALATPSIPGLEALSFMAGPSGVQASTILDELTLNEDVAFGQGNFQDSFMESSLFNDMSVLLNADTFVDQAYPWSATPHPQTIS